MKKFDLNIEEILDNWDIEHAIREIIANALDEQNLTNTTDMKIFQDAEGNYHIKDFGRGLNYKHFTQKENTEKIHAEGIIGKFGIGLKDALATFNRHHIGVKIISKNGIFTIEKSEKKGFKNILTLHVCIEENLDNDYIGTEVILYGVVQEDMEKAKRMFLIFSDDAELSVTEYGTIISKTSSGNGVIYVNGVKVAEEGNFLFSYNITKLNVAINKALNRERSNVGRSAYTNSVKSILLNSNNKYVMEKIANDFEKYSLGVLHDELKWLDIQEHAVKILNQTGNIIFSTTKEISASPDLIDEASSSGYTIVNIPENIKDKVQNNIDLEGEQIREFDYFIKERNEGFEFDFVDYHDLSEDEKKIYNLIPNIVEWIGGIPKNVIEIVISERMQSDDYLYMEAEGLFLKEEQRIVIKRSLLADREKFIGVLLHELAHAKSGFTDATRGFENELTNFLGIIGNALTLSFKNSRKLMNTSDINYLKPSNELAANSGTQIQKNKEIEDYKRIETQERGIRRWQDEFFQRLCDTHNLRQCIKEFQDYFPSDIELNINAPILCHLYSLSRGKVYGSGLANIVAVANVFLHSYSMYGDIFFRVIDQYNVRKYLYQLDKKKTFRRKEEKYYLEKPEQVCKNEEIFNILFFMPDDKVENMTLDNKKDSDMNTEHEKGQNFIENMHRKIKSIFRMK